LQGIVETVVDLIEPGRVLTGDIQAALAREMAAVLACGEGAVDWGGTDAITRTLLADAQTSGGLLIAIQADAVAGLLSDLEVAASTAAA
jgi:hypothetical protein